MITYDGIIFSTPSRVGGIATYVRELFGRAVAQFDDVTLRVQDPDFDAGEPRLRSHVQFSPARAFERVRSVPAPRGIVHTSYYRLASARSVRSVVTVYDFVHERFLTGPRAWALMALKRRAIERADALICISENTRRDLQSFFPGCDMGKVVVTHLAASEEFRPLEGGGFRENGRPFAMFVGSRASYKNFDAAIDAVQQTREFELVVVANHAFTVEESRTLERKLPGRHRFESCANVAALNVLYNQAACLLYPSKYEGFGMPPLEAMRAGCPFVALAQSSIPEIAGDAGILLEEADPTAMASAIERCAMAESRARMRALGFERARDFSWQHTFDKTADLYRALLP